MITVHHLNNSRSQRVLWLLEELDLPYEIVHHQRDAKTMLAPPALEKVHPLGKSPVICETLPTGEAVTVAETGAIVEHVLEVHGAGRLRPAPGTEAARRFRYWLHFAEGSAMPPLLLTLIFDRVANAPMPFFVKPIARELCKRVQKQLIDPNVNTSLAFIEDHLGRHTWFAGDQISLADFQMSFAVSALLSRSEAAAKHPHLAAYALHAWLERVHARAAYQRALAKGGPVVMES